MSRTRIVWLWAVLVSRCAAQYNLWTRQSGTSNNDGPSDVIVDSLGNIYVSGNTAGALDGQAYAGGNSDVFVMKYAPDGSKLWTKLSGTSGTDSAGRLTVDPAGNILFTGAAQGALDGQPYIGSDDIFLMKYAPNGTKLWTKLSGSSASEGGSGVSVDGMGNIYIVGSTLGALDGQSNAGGYDIFLMKYAQDGAKLWTRVYGSTISEYGVGVAVDGSGTNIYLTGTAQGSLDGQPYYGLNDIFVMKYTSDGVKQWTRQTGNSWYDEGKTVAVNSDGDIYVTANTGMALDGQSGNGGVDIVLMKYTPDGAKLWTRLHGTAQWDMPSNSRLDNSGYIYVTGWTEGAMNGGTPAGTSTGDIFIMKLAPDGTRLWAVQTGTSGSESGEGVSVDSLGFIYAACTVSSSLNGQPHAGGNDIALVKYNQTVAAPTSASSTDVPTASPATILPTSEPSLSPSASPSQSTFFTTWEGPLNGTAGINWYGICSDASGARLVAVAPEWGIYTSSNYGNAWTKSNAPVMSYSSVDCDASGRYVVAGAEGTGGLWTSSDYGSSWTQTLANLRFTINSVAFNYNGSQVVAGSNGGNLYVSYDKGATWSVLLTSSVQWIPVVSDATGQHLSFGVDGGGGTYYSTNNGATVLQSSAPGRFWYSMTMDSSGQYVAVAGVNAAGIYYSSNYGKDWSQAPGGTSEKYYAMASSGGQTMAAATEGTIIYLSTNNGLSWYASNSPSTTWISLAMDENSKYLYAAARTNGIYRSTNLSPSDVSTASPSEVPTLSMSPTTSPSTIPSTSAPSLDPSALPSVFPSEVLSAHPSAYPTATPTIAALDEKDDALLTLTFRKFDSADIIAAMLVLVFMCCLLLWLGLSRRKEALRCVADATDGKDKDQPSYGIMEFNSMSYAQPLISFWSLTSNLGQTGTLLENGYVANAYIIVVTYLLTFILSVLAQVLVFKSVWIMKYSDLSLRLHPNALSRNRFLWSFVALLSLCDVFYLRFFPWSNNEFCQRSDGFPTMSVFLFVHITNVVKNIVITAALSSTSSLNVVQFMALCCSLVILLLSIYTICIKLLFEKINLLEVVVVSKDFAERANSLGISLSTIMGVDILSENNPIEVGPLDLDAAIEEQLEMKESLSDLMAGRESRQSLRLSERISDVKSTDSMAESSSSTSTDNPYAAKTIEALKRQVETELGRKPVEYIPLPVLKAELNQLLQAASEGSPFDENRLDHLIRCMEYNDEYISQRLEEERRWDTDSKEFLSKSLETMRPFVSVNISSMTLQDLENAGLSKALAKRIMTKRCLWLIRMSQSDIAKMHVADLTSKYGTEAQNLDVIEMAAIYCWLQDVKFESDVGDKKKKLRDNLKRSLKEKMGIKNTSSTSSVSSYDELVKKRNVSYKNQEGPFASDLDAVFTQPAVSSEDAFAPPRLSLRYVFRSSSEMGDTQDLLSNMFAKSEESKNSSGAKIVSAASAVSTAPKEAPTDQNA